MKNAENADIWYGELRTSKGNTIVIRDDQLPPASKGRIYLYNTDRHSFVQYDESIVTPKLFPLDDDARSEAAKQHENNWATARKQLIRAHSKAHLAANDKTRASTDDLLPTDDDIDGDDFDDDDED